MRNLLIAMLVAGGLGLVGPSAASAAPVTGSAAKEAADLLNSVEPVQHLRWESRGTHWRWGSRGTGGHLRWGSLGRSRPLRRASRGRRR